MKEAIERDVKSKNKHVTQETLLELSVDLDNMEICSEDAEILDKLSIMEQNYKKAGICQESVNNISNYCI